MLWLLGGAALFMLSKRGGAQPQGGAQQFAPTATPEQMAEAQAQQQALLDQVALDQASKWDMDRLPFWWPPTYLTQLKQTKPYLADKIDARIAQLKATYDSMKASQDALAPIAQGATPLTTPSVPPPTTTSIATSLMNRSVLTKQPAAAPALTMSGFGRLSCCTGRR